MEPAGRAIDGFMPIDLTILTWRPINLIALLKDDRRMCVQSLDNLTIALGFVTAAMGAFFVATASGLVVLEPELWRLRRWLGSDQELHRRTAVTATIRRATAKSAHGLLSVRRRYSRSCHGCKPLRNHRGAQFRIDKAE